MKTGIDVIINDYACIQSEYKQFRFPSSKKKRIRKKWAKRKENFRLADVHKCIFFKNENKVLVSTKIFNELNKHIPTNPIT